MMNNEQTKFDVIIGNPPYQENTKQIYVEFYLEALKQAKTVCFITPSNWQNFNTANGLGRMNTDEIKKDKHIVFIDNLIDAFPNVAGAKYANIILRNRFYDNKLNGKQLIFGNGKNPKTVMLPTKKEEIKKPKEILEIVKKVNLLNEDSISSIGLARRSYGFRADPINNPDKYNLTLSDKRSEQYNIRLFALRGRSRDTAFIEEFKLPKKSHLINHYKLFVSKCWGNMTKHNKYLGGSYSKIEIAEPLDVCSESYIEFGSFKDKQETLNARKYFYTKFFRAVLFKDKTSHNTSVKTYISVPLQDFTDNSDIDWSKSIPEIDQQLYKKYNLSDEDISFIEKNIKPM